MKQAYELLSLKQLNEKFMFFKKHAAKRPENGWIQYTREALFLSASGLARLLNITQPSVLQMEKNESNKKITLETLEKAANAMGCDVVYTFVPKTSMNDFVAQKKKELSKKMAYAVHHSMILEEQGLSEKNLKVQQAIIEEALEHESLKYLWRNL